MLTVNVPPTFATRWLAPRLSDFRARFPAIDLHITTDRIASLREARALDCLVVFAQEPWARARCEPVLKECHVMVSSPALWRADSFYSMAELLMRNLGWAWLPRHVLHYPVYQQHLCELASDWTPPPLVVELVWRRDEPLGPAARCLAECLREHLQALG